ncbi:cyclase family protein [Permianibacter sp. IMCC34836]|uniref:cyclase family protein n=1 Tax=Permianibacter fluminis TaxID=2738515 RepID=UPI001554E46F|nr:cyclase family protein [Permianibacter fluminis]NQD37158.1 cyclase family protein [Permianibacter fluminis]
MAEQRVVFDFAISFSNGGGIQGQGFRLDIIGDDISDDALATYIVQDLRLLMVSKVDILKKRIIAEAHKRGELDHTAAIDNEAAANALFIDLSHRIEHGMITYKGLPAPLICDHLSREQSRQHYAAGTEFQIGRIDMVANTGTYLDTPYHRYADGIDLAGMPLTRIANLPGLVVRVQGSSDRAIDWPSFAASDVAGKAVLVHTGWSRHWRTDQYFEGHPFLTERAAVYLRDCGAALVGIDSLNIDDISTGQRPVHSTLLAAGIPIVEHLTGLENLPIDGFRFSAVPPKICGMGTFPVRAHAWLPVS